MFSEDWGNRKRYRDEEPPDNEGASGFCEHRTKRRIAALPHRGFPNQSYDTPSGFAFGTSYGMNFGSQPAPPTITPVDSESESVGTPKTTEPKSFFSPYSSSPGMVIESSPTSPFREGMQASQSTQMADIPSLLSDDFEMTDSAYPPPSPLQPEASPRVSGRIPTPIHSSFAPYIRAEKASLHPTLDMNHDASLIDRLKRGRRLPSPISEGEMSPSVIVDGLGDMQMEVDHSSSQPSFSQPDSEGGTPTKRGHQRSKHSLRQWTGLGGDMSSNGVGVKRSFSMGYRADCEKCRMKVPGHFSHIITI